MGNPSGGVLFHKGFEEELVRTLWHFAVVGCRRSCSTDLQWLLPPLERQKKWDLSKSSKTILGLCGSATGLESSARGYFYSPLVLKNFPLVGWTIWGYVGFLFGRPNRRQRTPWKVRNPQSGWGFSILKYTPIYTYLKYTYIYLYLSVRVCVQVFQ